MSLVTHRDIWSALRHTRAFLADRLANPPPPSALFVGTVTPLAAVRGVAVLLRSVIAGSLLPGLVLGLGSFVLQLGVWLGLGLVLPALARQFGEEIDDRRGFALATYASIPMWLAGTLYVVPEDFWVLFLWSRGLVAIVSLGGLFILHHGFAVLEIHRKVRGPLLLGLSIAYLTAYVLLSVLVGIAAHIVLYIVAPSA
jgi:hypothetical protein